MRRAVVLFFFFATAARAQSTDLINADRPGLADSSATMHRGAFQIEAGYERDDDEDFEPTLLRYGLTDAFELRLATSDWKEAEVGFKYHFREQPSLGIIASVSSNSAEAVLAADFEFGERWAINPNVGVSVDDDTTSALAALTVQYNLSERANVFIDGAWQSPKDTLLDAGAAWVLGQDTQLDVSIGWGVKGSNVPDLFWSAGISRRF